MPACSEPRDRLGVDHVVQRVEQRPQVRVDLVVERAGQEAEPLAGLDRGPGQDDAGDLLGLQRLHRLGDGEVGLAGAGRADAEDDRVLVDGVDVALLVQRLGTDVLAAPRQDVQAEHLGRAGPGVGGEDAERAADRVRGEVLAGLDQFEQLLEQADGDGVVGRRAGDGDLVAADVDVAVEAALDDAQQFVARAEQRQPWPARRGRRRRWRRDPGCVCGSDKLGFLLGDVDPSTVPAEAPISLLSARRPAHPAARQARGRGRGRRSARPGPVLNTVRKSPRPCASTTARMPANRAALASASAPRSTMFAKCCLRDHQDVRRRLRVDVVERQRVVVLVDLVGRDVAGDDRAEEAVSSHAGRLLARSRYQRPSRGDSAARAAAPAVDVRSTVSPSRTADAPALGEGSQLLVADAAFGADDQHELAGRGSAASASGADACSCSTSPDPARSRSATCAVVASSATTGTRDAAALLGRLAGGAPPPSRAL